jgi:dihydroflavonol-4-reductase
MSSPMIFVTGASGLIGGNLVRTLLDQGLAVRALVHSDRRALAGLDVETVQADLLDSEALAQAMCGCEVVYHLAGLISLEMNTLAATEQINVHGVRAVVDASLRAGVRRLIHFSSIHALDTHPHELPVDEDRPLVDEHPGPDVPPYDLTKAMGVREVQAGIRRGLDAVILYPTGILGPFDFKPSFFGQALLLMARGLLPALVPGGFDWVDVRDVVTGALAAQKVATQGAGYLLSGHHLSVRGIAELVAGVTGRPSPRLTIPLKLASAAAPLLRPLSHFNNGQPLYTRASLRALHSDVYVSHAKAERELGYTPRPLQETIRETLEWFKQQGLWH